MAIYRYTECGLDNVLIHGVEFVCDDAGDEVVCIPNVNGLHRVIAEAILSRKGSISGRELRFIRTEVGLTQAELASLVHREPLAISRWERGESPIDANAQVLIRLYAMERLKLRSEASVKDLAEWCVPAASEPPISIDGRDTDNYHQIAA